MSIEKNLERIADALEALVALGGQTTTTVGNVSFTQPAAEKAPKGRGRAKKSEEAPAAETAPAPEPEPKAKPEAAKGGTAEVSRDELRDALRRYREHHSKQEARALLEQHGASSISSAPEDALAAILESFEKAIKAKS